MRLRRQLLGCSAASTTAVTAVKIIDHDNLIETAIQEHEDHYHHHGRRHHHDRRHHRHTTSHYTRGTHGKHYYMKSDHTNFGI